jgi:hypothetical protein
MHVESASWKRLSQLSLKDKSGSRTYDNVSSHFVSEYGNVMPVCFKIRNFKNQTSDINLKIASWPFELPNLIIFNLFAKQEMVYQFYYFKSLV